MLPSFFGVFFLFFVYCWYICLVTGTLKRVLAFPGEFVNDPDHPPIPVEQFAKHVIKLHKSDDRGYMIEYNVIILSFAVSVVLIATL